MTELNAMSETDASNTSISGASVAENCAMSGLNDAQRNAVGMAKRAYDRDHAGSWCTVGGTANAITLTYSVGPAAYVTGEKYAFKATATNSGATTVNVSGLGAKNVFAKASASGPQACVGGEIQNGDIVEIEYDGTQFQLLGVSADLKLPGLATKATPVAADSFVIMDSAASSAAKTATLSSFAASSSSTLTGSAVDKFLTPGGFAANLLSGANGFYKFPGGTIVAWGQVSVAASTTSTFSFGGGLTFGGVNAFLCSYVTTAALAGPCGGQSISATQFQIKNNDSSTQTIAYLAVGT